MTQSYAYLDIEWIQQMSFNITKKRKLVLFIGSRGHNCFLMPQTDIVRFYSSWSSFEQVIFLVIYVCAPNWFNHTQKLSPKIHTNPQMVEREILFKRLEWKDQWIIINRLTKLCEIITQRKTRLNSYNVTFAEQEIERT